MARLAIDRKLALAFVGAASAALTGFADGGFVAFGATVANAAIVHTPAEAFRNGKGENPVSDSRGAKWTAGRVYNATDSIVAAELLPTWSERKGVDFVGFIDYRDFTDTPVIFVNTTQDTVIDTDGTPYYKGEVFFHPDCNDRMRGMLSFTVPRDGFYSLSAQFRTTNPGMDGFSSYVDTTITVGGETILSEDIVHAVNGVCQKGTKCEFKHRFLTAGTEINFVVGPGFADTVWPTYGCDATALWLEITEEDMPAGSVLHTATEFFSKRENPATDSRGARWSVAKVEDSAGIVTYSDYLTDNKVFVTSLEGYNVNRGDWHDTPAAGGNFSGGPVDFGGAVYQGGEVFLHPDFQSPHRAALTFTVPRDGLYTINAQFRTTDPGTSDGASTKVDTTINIDGRIVFQEEVSHDGVRQFGTSFNSERLHLLAGQQVNFVVGPGLNETAHSCDGTALRLGIVEEPFDGEGWNVGQALKDMASKGDARTNPFVYQNATWSLGFYGWDPFDLLTVQRNDFPSAGSGFFGFASDGTRGGADNEMPICGNTNTEIVQIGGHDVYPGWFAMHPYGSNPGSNPWTVIRFTVPEDGVYSVAAIFRDYDGTASVDWAADGISAYVKANGNIVASGTARIDYGDRKAAYLTPDRLYLKGGEIIDLIFMPNNYYNWDMTVANAFIGKEDMKIVVSLDLNAGNSATFADAGRVGFVSPKPWTALAIADGAESARCENLRIDSGKRSKVAFEIAPAQGGMAVANGEGNALMADGVVAANDAAAYNWSITGLEKNAAYTFYLYGTGGARFTAGGASGTLTGTWFGGAADHAVISVQSDATGAVSGTFSGSAEAAGVFCGLQIEGDSFKERTGLVLIAR